MPFCPCFVLDLQIARACVHYYLILWRPACIIIAVGLLSKKIPFTSTVKIQFVHKNQQAITHPNLHFISYSSWFANHHDDQTNPQIRHPTKLLHPPFQLPPLRHSNLRYCHRNAIQIGPHHLQNARCKRSSAI
jgi:hypothetical protein